jgi:hypothetical protein
MRNLSGPESGIREPFAVQTEGRIEVPLHVELCHPFRMGF